MVAAPAVTPVTVDPVTEALALLLLHVPPAVASDTVADTPTQRLNEAGLIAVGRGLIVTTWVTKPHPL